MLLHWLSDVHWAWWMHLPDRQAPPEHAVPSGLFLQPPAPSHDMQTALHVLSVLPLGAYVPLEAQHVVPGVHWAYAQVPDLQALFLSHAVPSGLFSHPPQPLHCWHAAWQSRPFLPCATWFRNFVQQVPSSMQTWAIWSFICDWIQLLYMSILV